MRMKMCPQQERGTLGQRVRSECLLTKRQWENVRIEW